MTRDRYQHVIRAIFETPWAIRPETLAMIIDLARFRAGGGKLEEDEIAERLAAAAGTNGPRAGGGRRKGSVAVIPIYGLITPRQNLMSATSGGTSVEQLTESFREAIADPEIGSIAFDVDSPGGMVDGIDELASEIRASRGQKPIVAVANYMAASAAYYLASQADELVVSPSGQVGSIGVLTAHQDLSKAYDAAGVKTTLISYGKFKTEGNEFEPLSDDARAELQAKVDELGRGFELAVARGRGVSVDAVRSDYGQGRMKLAKAALAAGMVDRIDTLDSTVRRLASGRPVRSRAAAPGDQLDNGARAMIVATSSDQAERTYEAARRYIESADWDRAIALAGPLKAHSTATDDDAWDGPAEEAKIPNDAGEVKISAHYAWRDDSADPETKAAYKFIHHRTTADGSAGSASTTACSAGIAVLNGGRTGTTIPDGDKAGVHAHLARHLEDAGLEAPPLQLDNPRPTALETAPTFTARLEAVTAEAEAVTAIATARAARRRQERERAPLSTAHRSELARLQESLLETAGSIGALLSISDEPTPGARQPTGAELEILIASYRGGYHLPTTEEQTNG